MASPIRIERLQEVIKQRVSQIVQFELSDPRIGIVTITKIKLSKDMSECVVYYSTLGSPQDRSKCKHALDHSTGFIQREVAHILHTRVTPHLTFIFDPSIEGSARISAMLREVLPPIPETYADLQALRGDDDETDEAAGDATDAGEAEAEGAPKTDEPAN